MSPGDLIAALLAPERRAWQGRESLARAFWGHGVLASAVLTLLYAHAAIRGGAMQQQVSLALLAAYTGWALVAIWRCAGNATPFWGLMTRWVTVAWAGNAALVLLFLQLDLAVSLLEP